jgi:Tfp pilus assembly protein PilX
MSRNKQLFSFKNKFCISAHDQSGIALPLVLMVLIVLTILGTAGWTASQSSLKQSSLLETNLQCKYLARSAVDATKEAWTAKWIEDPDSVPVSQTFYNKYDETDKKFVQATEGEYNSQDYVIKTVQTYSDGICTITSTAKIGTKTATVKAVSEKLTDTDVSGITDPWYKLNDYNVSIRIRIIPGIWEIGFDLPRWSEWSIMPGSVSQTITDDEGLEYNATYHTTEGKVVIQTDGGRQLFANGTVLEDLKQKTGQTVLGLTDQTLDSFLFILDMFLYRDNIHDLTNALGGNAPFNYSVTGLQAKRIDFECPVNLYWNSSVMPNNIDDWIRDGLRTLGLENLGYFPNPHSLIVSAEIINFTGDLIIGNSAFGNLTLSLPPGGGIPGDEVYRAVAKQNAARNPADRVNLDLIHKDAKYGVVRFGGKVKVEYDTSYANNASLVNGKIFFFCPPDGKALSIGTEPTTFSEINERFGLNITVGPTVEDTRFQTLINKGYLIPASQNDMQNYRNVVFHYE